MYIYAEFVTYSYVEFVTLFMYVIGEFKAFGVHSHTREARNVFICRVRDSFMYVIQVTSAHFVHIYGVRDSFACRVRDVLTYVM